MVPCLSISPRLLPILALLWFTTPYPPQVVSTRPALVLSCGLTSKAQASLHLPQQMSVLAWDLSGGTYCLKVSFHFALASQLLHPLWGSSWSLSQLISPPKRELHNVQKPLLFHSLLPGTQVPSQFLSLFFLSSFVLLSYMKIFLPFRKSEVFFQCSVDVLCK